VLAHASERVLPDREREIRRFLQHLQPYAQKLGYVPVFVFGSLVEDYREVLGDIPVRKAILTGFEHDVLANTSGRGSPTRPGLVASARESSAGRMGGLLLQLPLARAEPLLNRLFSREGIYEQDKYLLKLGRTEGELGDVEAVVFATNPDSPLAIGPTLDSRTAADLMHATGTEGSSLDYWRDGFIAPRERLGLEVPESIRRAVELAARTPPEGGGGGTGADTQE